MLVVANGMIVVSVCALVAMAVICVRYVRQAADNDPRPLDTAGEPLGTADG